MSSCNYEAKGVAVSANSIKKAKMAVKVTSWLFTSMARRINLVPRDGKSPGNEVAEGFEPWTTGQTTLARTVKAGLGLSFSRHF